MAMAMAMAMAMHVATEKPKIGSNQGRFSFETAQKWSGVRQ
ncbi:hypothetical protein OHA40_02210 [Nocardia sp. NBC_00508]|nr:hypothetical protein [Nocardia sp. NBC_00508]WUD66997.1 hypothetical protein OHA40_02210 [Nocardia sp. NBC_00508]